MLSSPVRFCPRTVLLTVVPKDEIRLRIAAAKALNPELDTWEKLAKATEISSSTLKSIATPNRKAKAQKDLERDERAPRGAPSRTKGAGKAGSSVVLPAGPSSGGNLPGNWLGFTR